MNKVSGQWKNLWTSLWDTMWENCGNLLWKTNFGFQECVKVRFSTSFLKNSGKVSPWIYTSFNRVKWRVLHSFHIAYYYYY